MFKPIDVYYQKKSGKGDSKKELHNKWLKLSDKKLKKFVKKAEKKYDAAYQENPTLKPFIFYLNKKEAKLLFKSYGLPDKVPNNRKTYYMQSVNNGDVKSVGEVVIKKESDTNWTELSASQKQELSKDYEKALLEFNSNYFDFVRNLPDQRVIDFKTSFENDFFKKKNDRRKVSDEKSYQTKFIPFMYFYEKFKKENPKLSLKDSRTNARLKFKSLNSKKKLSLIKSCAENYDKEIEGIDKDTCIIFKRPFAQYLNKDELKLLMESYGMPQTVPNLSAYYFQLNYGQFKNEPDGMSKTFEKFRNMHEKEKNELIEKHKNASEEYSVLQTKFLENLPANRKEDYDYLIKKPKDEHLSNGKSSKKQVNDKVKIKKEPLSFDEDEKQQTEKKDKSKELNNKKKLKKILSDSEQSDVEKNDDQNSVYESAGESDASRSSDNSIKINESKEIDVFVSKQSKRPENAFSIFIQEEIKWNVKSKMTEHESKQFLNKLAQKWTNLSKIEKEKLEKKFDETKKELKKNIKEFIMNELRNGMSPDELLKKINEHASKQNRRIMFKFENEKQIAYLSDFMSLIPVSIENIEFNTKVNGTYENDGDASSKRKITDDNSNSKNNVKKLK